MSSPASVGTPKVTYSQGESEQDVDIQAKLQQMISMQYEELEYSQRFYDDTPDLDLHRKWEMGSTTSSGNDHPGSMERESTLQKDTTGLNRTEGSAMANSSPGTERSLLQTEDSTNHRRLQSGVGRGTLLFPSTYYNGSAAAAGMMEHGSLPQPKQSPQLLQRHPPSLTSYGAMHSTPPLQVNSTTLEQQQQQRQRQQHEFHYGNPDYHDPLDGSSIHNNKNDMHHPQSPSNRRRRNNNHYCYRPQNSLCGKCCCWYTPIVNILMQENVQRSFCFGATDGLLTGSAIVSAFGALNVLTMHTGMDDNDLSSSSSLSSWDTRVAVVIFTMAACMADAICMAIGHVWTSFVASSAHDQELKYHQRLLEQSRGDAKAKLVQMLMEDGGMLKIDAMSLADTLEGYPDMFVNALMGDSLFAGSGSEDRMISSEDDITEDGELQQQQQPSNPFLSSSSPSLQGTGWGSFGGGNGSLGSFWRFASYSQFQESNDKSETGTVNLVLKESQMEGIFMMLGFSLFAVIPSLLWLLLPTLLAPSDDPDADTNISRVSEAHPGSPAISMPSLVASISGLVVWVLGVWKSQFLNSHWVVSGIENVIVLLICTVSAYGVGMALCYTLGRDLFINIAMAGTKTLY